jgi:putative inorganic carbon (HCO3(-)) transporter
MTTHGIQASSRGSPLAFLWAGTLAVAAAAGATVASRPVLLLGVLGLALVVAGAVLLFAQPRWTLLGSLFLLVSYAVAVFREAGSPLTMRTLIVLLLLGLATRYVVGAERAAWPGRETVLLGLLAMALLISTAFASEGDRAFRRVLEIGDGAVLALLMVALLDRTAWLRRAMWTYAVAAGALAALALLQQATGTYGATYGGFANVTSDGSLLRSTGPIDANYFGQLLLAAGALALYLALSSSRRGARLFAAALGVVCVGGLIVTFSRGSLFAAVVVAAVVARLRRVRLWLPLTGVLTAVVAGLLLLPAEAKERIAVLAEPAESGVATGDPSLRGRFSENLAAVQMFADHPYVGVGPDNYPERYLEYSETIGLDPRREERHPHNLYLEALAEYGAIGAAAFFAVLAFALRGAWLARGRLTTDGLLAEGAFVALLGFVVNGVFLQASYPHYLWITIGLALAAGRLGRSSPEPLA